MLYAAYGSNLHPLRLQQRTPSAKLVGTAAIAHYALKFHKRGYRDFSGKCNLVFQRGAIAYTAVYDVPSHEIVLLDKAEGAGAGYDRTLINVNGFGDCLIYLAAPEHINKTLLPFSWYKALVIAGCEKLVFPDSYIEKIRAVEAIRDLKCDRHSIHMNLVHKCQIDQCSQKENSMYNSLEIN